MSATITSAEAAAERVGQLQAGMADSGRDALVLRLAENVVLASGYYVQAGGTATVFVPAEGEATLIVPDYEAAEAATRFGGPILTTPAIRLDGPSPVVALREHLSGLGRSNDVRRAGYEGGFESIAPATLAGEPNAVGLPTAALLRETLGLEELVDVTELLESTRAIKNAYDLDRLETVNEVAMIGLDAFKRLARPGISEVALAAEVEAAILREGSGHRGARIVRGWATILSGPGTSDGWQYFRSSTRLIEADDVVMLEMGTVADGYWADHTRTVVAGRADAAQQAAFDAARGATFASFAAAVSGATGDAVDSVARAYCAERGFEQFPHHTGHGTGFRYHETRPQIVPGSSHVLEAGMVIASEPGIYNASGGFRWEDNAVVGSDGARVLATSDWGLAD
jgi:Xaa-Pro aminopeptidase